MTLIHHPAPTRKARGADRDAVSRVLTAAFLDDPVFVWIEPDRTAREAVLPTAFAGFVDAFARHDATHVAPSEGLAVTGAALWSPAGVAPVDPADEAALEASMTGFADESMMRLGICLELFAGAHPHEPAWFLQFLGVDPTHQGQGVGSVLLRQVLDGADRAGEAAYLEATTQRNRALYERHGFRQTGEIVLPDGPTVYPMWRDPA
jgi:ribosomal protein S18 acetylase RimI-like enzyme